MPSFIESFFMKKRFFSSIPTTEFYGLKTVESVGIFSTSLKVRRSTRTGNSIIVTKWFEPFVFIP